MTVLCRKIILNLDNCTTLIYNKSFKFLNKKSLFSCLVFLLGLVILGMALAISIMKATVLRITYSLTSVIGGPLIGVFTLGVFFPWVTAKVNFMVTRSSFIPKSYGGCLTI